MYKLNVEIFAESIEDVLSLLNKVTTKITETDDFGMDGIVGDEYKFSLIEI